jgi:LysM repeat protein
MNMKRFLVILAVLVLAVGLASCERDFAEAEGTAPPTGVVSGPTSTTDIMGEIVLRATQTAMALEQLAGTATPTVVEETPAATEPPQDTPVPTPEPQPTAVLLPSPTPGRPASYTLQEGEFVFCIARRFDVNQYELLNLNGLNLSSRPRAGTTLTIPTTGNPFSGNRTLSPHPTTYTVGSGDSINSIACKYGDVSPDMIATANNLTAPYSLTAGQTLQIP